MKKFLVAVLAAIGLFGLNVPSAHAVGGTLEMGAFAYVWPSDSYLTGLVSSTTTPNPPAFVVLNIGNGQTNDVAQLDSVADSLRARGIKVYGYVDTGYGARSLSTVKADIDRWLDPGFVNTSRTDGDQHYDGIFLDQMTRECVVSSVDYRPYYSELTEYAKDSINFWYSATGSVMANPGQAVEDCMPGYAYYAPMPDLYVTFEGTESTYNNSYLGGNVFNTTDGYYDGNFYFPNQFVHIVHTATSNSQSSFNGLVDTADSRGARYLFVTQDAAVVNGQASNPFDVRPNYFNDMISHAAGL